MQYAVDRSDRSPHTLPLYFSLFSGDFLTALSLALESLKSCDDGEKEEESDVPTLEMSSKAQAFGDCLQVLEFKEGPEVCLASSGERSERECSNPFSGSDRENSSWILLAEIFIHCRFSPVDVCTSSLAISLILPL